MFKNFNNQKKNGYTMIEILVVMSIIAFITVAAWYYIDYSRKLARDTKRVADLSQIQKALETFRNENGRYPDYVTDSISNSGECMGDQDSSGTDRTGISTCDLNRDDFERAMKDFMGNIPADPLHNCSTTNCTATSYLYSYDPSHPCDASLTQCPVICFSQSETGKYNCVDLTTTKDNPLCGQTWSGNGDMFMRGADYCILLK